MTGSPPKDDDDLELSLDETAQPARKTADDANAEMTRAQIQEHGTAIARLEKRVLKTEVQLGEHWKLLRALRRIVKRILAVLRKHIP